MGMVIILTYKTIFMVFIGFYLFYVCALLWPRREIRLGSRNLSILTIMTIFMLISVFVIWWC